MAGIRVTYSVRRVSATYRLGLSTGGGGGGSGDVVGPSSATDNAIARFDSTTGKLLQNSLVTISDAGSISLPASQTVDGRDVSDDGSTLDSHVAATSGAHGISAFGATLIDDANAAAARSTLGLGGAAVLEVGTGAGTVAAGDDSRLSDARTPTAHASSHLSGGSDPIAAATTSARGTVELATDGETASDVVVQGSDSRLLAKTAFVTFNANLNTAQAWTNMPSAEGVFLANSVRLPAELTRRTRCRLAVAQVAAAASGALIAIQYSIDSGTTWRWLDDGTATAGTGIGTHTPQIALSTGTDTNQTSGWTTLFSTAIADVLLRLIGSNGDGVADPSFRYLALEIE